MPELQKIDMNLKRQAELLALVFFETFKQQDDLCELLDMDLGLKKANLVSEVEKAAGYCGVLTVKNVFRDVSTVKQ